LNYHLKNHKQKEQLHQKFEKISRESGPSLHQESLDTRAGQAPESKSLCLYACAQLPAF